MFEASRNWTKKGLFLLLYTMHYNANMASKTARYKLNKEMITFFNFFSRQFAARLGRPVHDVGEAYADLEKLPVVVSVHRSRYESGQIHTFPWKGRTITQIS